MKNRFMNYLLISFSLLFLVYGQIVGQEEESKSKEDNPIVIFETTLGDLTIELYPDKAPITVENFLAYVDAGFFDETIFHRVIPGFVIQGGGFTEEMSEKSTSPPIKNEAENELKNERGTLSMARTREIDSATSQFFINLQHNEVLDHGARDFGYAVFAKVIEGMDIVDKIASVPTGNSGRFQDVPLKAVMIKSAYRKVEESKQE